MGIIASFYKKKLVCRYDKDGIIPYLSHHDFEGLKQENYSFKNSRNVDISYFFYHYEKYDDSKIVLFLHGIGSGHTAYMQEINYLCKAGYRVLTLDYMGCDSSSGKNLLSMNEPTRDVMDLLNHLSLKEKIVLVGHSLGGYTALNTINLRNDINKAIIISGFLSLESELSGFIKSKTIVKSLLKYEQRVEKEYYGIDNISYLKHTSDSLLFIHSKDDQMVKYESSLGIIEKIDNSNIHTIKCDGKKHNPNYSYEAIKYMNDVFGEYNYLVKKKKLKTYIEKRDFMRDKSAFKMTIQDEVIMKEIVDFIK